MHRRKLFRLTAALALMAWSIQAQAQDKLAVVASFSILGDMVARVGGDRVALRTLVGPDGDAHVYEPTPVDAQTVANAQLVIVNGLGFEGWLDRLIAASEFKGPVVVATTGIAPREIAQTPEADHPGHDHGDIDPHAWQTLANARIYVANIQAGLTAADPAGAAVYAANAAAYRAQIDAVEAEIAAAIAALPANRRAIVTSHDAFGYFGAAYGLSFLAPEGISTESEASAQDVAALITQIKAESIPAVFMENISDPRLLQRIVAETGAAVGGTLFSDALSPPNGPAASYLDMMRHNTRTLTAALGS